MTTRARLRPVRPALYVGGWVLVTYGFRIVTAVRARTWDSVAASVVLLGLSAAVAVAAVRHRAGRPGTARPLGRLVRVLAVVAAGWSVFRLVTVWSGTWSTAFRAVHTVIAGVLLLLAGWALAAVRSLPTDDDAVADRVGAGPDRAGAGPDRVGASLDRVGAGPDRVGAAVGAAGGWSAQPEVSATAPAEAAGSAGSGTWEPAGPGASTPAGSGHTVPSSGARPVSR